MEVLMGKSSVNGPFSAAMLNNKRVCHLDFSPLWKAKWPLARDSSLKSWMTMTEMRTGDAHFKKPVGNLWFLDGPRYWPIATWSMSCIWPSPSGCGNQSMVVVGDKGKTKTRKSNHVYNTKKALFWLKTPNKLGKLIRTWSCFERPKLAHFTPRNSCSWAVLDRSRWSRKHRHQPGRCQVWSK